MVSIGVPMAVVTLFWFLVGGIVPFFVRGNNKDLIKVMLVLTSVCCYMFWLCTIMHQLNPLIGPQLNNDTARALQIIWGNKFD